MKTKNKQYAAILACGAAFALFGLNVPFIKTSLLAVPLFLLLTVKFAFGSIFFAAISYKSWKPVKNNIRTRIIVSTVAGYVLTSVLLYKGIELAGGLSAALIYLLAPLMLYFASIRFLREKYNSRLLAGVIAGFLGAVTIVLAPLFGNSNEVQTSLIGNLLILLAVIMDVSGSVIVKPAMPKVSAMQMTALRFIIATVVLIPFAIPEIDQASKINWDQQTVVAVGYNLIFATLVAYFLYHWGFKKISGEQISPLHYLDTLFGAVGSVVILHESPSLSLVVGILLIGGGLYFGEGHRLKFGHHIGHHR